MEFFVIKMFLGSTVKVLKVNSVKNQFFEVTTYVILQSKVYIHIEKAGIRKIL